MYGILYGSRAEAERLLPCRAQFVPQMVSSLMKLGLPQNAMLENRRLAIDLAALLVRWEQQRLTSPPPGPQVNSVCSWECMANGSGRP